MKDHTLEVPKFEGNVMNVQQVGVNGDNIVVLKPLTTLPKSAALVHAAWLVAGADQTSAGSAHGCFAWSTKTRSPMNGLLGMIPWW